MALTGPADGPAVLPPSGLVPAGMAMGEELARLTADGGRPVELDALALLAERAAVGRSDPAGPAFVRRRLRTAADRRRVARRVPAAARRRGDGPGLAPVRGSLPALVAGRSSAELVASAADLGLAVAALGETDTAARAPVVATPGAAATGPPTDLAEAVVVDLSSLWAGPLCGHVLGAAGARVIKVESVAGPTAPGRARRRSSTCSTPATSRSPSTSPTRTVGGRSRALVERADVVIEASRPRALAQLGIDAAAEVGRRPVVWVSITGHGRDAGLRTAFGDDAAVAGGLVAGGSGGGPWFCADAVADPLTGLTAAVAALDRWTTGGGWLLDVSMASVAAACAGPQMRRCRRTGRSRRRRAPASRPAPARPLGADTDAVLAELVAPARRRR